MSKNIFFTKFSELSDRLDPSYYLPMYKELENKLKKSGFKLKKLEEICEISRGGSPRPIQEYLTKDSDGINWIKIGDTKNINKYIYKTKQKIKPSGVKHSRLVKDGDFILSNSMSFGKPYIMRTIGCIHDGWLLLRKKDNMITEDFLYTILSTNLIYQFFKRVTIGGVVENLNIELVKKIIIPIPDITIQAKIVNKLDNAIRLKEQKEKEAQNKLDSIDSYLLKELGIELPSNEKESLEDRIFLRKFSNISGERLDPFYIKNNKKYSNDNQYKEVNVKSIATIKKGKSITKDNITNGSYPVIAGGQTSPYSINRYNEDKNVITISASGAYAGYVWYHSSKIFASDCNVVRSIDENIITTLYLFEILKAKQNYIYNLQQGAGQPHIYGKDIEPIKIPLPSIDIQNKITNHIQQLRDEAKELKEEAIKIYEDTKQEIENMILGEAYEI